jgi:osmotically-inducible protein OsmY
MIPDQLVEQYVRVNLRSDPIVDDSDIQVTVRDGVVTLEGNVVCIEEVELAEKIAQETRGTKDVVTRLHTLGHRCILRYHGARMF